MAGGPTTPLPPSLGRGGLPPRGPTHRLISLRLALGLSVLVVAVGIGFGVGRDDPPLPASSGTPAATETGAPPGSGILACLATSSAGIDDGGLNGAAYKGLIDAQQQLGVSVRFVETGLALDDGAASIEGLVAEGCDLVVTVGQELGPETAAAARAHPDRRFLVVDHDLAGVAEGERLGNVRELTFKSEGAAFLAGYVAAAISESRIVGAFGGADVEGQAPVLDAFAAGIRAHGADGGGAVALVGWDPVSRHSTLFGDLSEESQARGVARTLIEDGADVVFPLAGPAGLGAAEAARQAGGVRLIGWDTDQFLAAPDYADLWLTSVQKNVDLAVFEAIRGLVDGAFAGGRYEGTLGNGGVGLAPFHALDPLVPQGLRDRLAELSEDLVAGRVSMNPFDYP
jgi:basic membrane protein A and related proteins